jgi:hypothetical protein
MSLKRNTELIFYTSLVDSANRPQFKANPTLAAGDVKVATDDGAPANLATLPVVDADFTKRIKVTVSTGEMNGVNTTLIFSDVAGAEWDDLTINLHPPVRELDDLAFPTTSGRSIDVLATGEVGIDLDNAVGALGTAQFDADFLTNALLADNVIAAEQIAANAITATKVADAAIDAATFAAGAINAAAIADAAIDAATFAAGAINAAAIATGAIDADAIADNAIDAGALAADCITAAKIANGAIDNAALAADMDTYQAKVVFLDDDGGATDLYLVTFFKNGEPVTSGITSPTIQIIKASDGTDLVAVGALTEIGALGMFKKAETSNRIVAGSGYIAKTQATIASATRTWLQPVGRDS